jgi:hypothetical protein
MPDLHSSILGARDDDGELGVEAGEGNVRRMTLKSRNERFRCVVPYLDGAVVGGGEDIGFISRGVVVDVVNTCSTSVTLPLTLSIYGTLCLMSFQGEVGTSTTP